MEMSINVSIADPVWTGLVGIVVSRSGYRHESGCVKVNVTLVHRGTTYFKSTVSLSSVGVTQPSEKTRIPVTLTPGE